MQVLLLKIKVPYFLISIIHKECVSQTLYILVRLAIEYLIKFIDFFTAKQMQILNDFSIGPIPQCNSLSSLYRVVREDPTRIVHSYAVRRYFTGNKASGINYCATTDICIWQYQYISSNPNIVANLDVSMKGVCILM